MKEGNFRDKKHTGNIVTYVMLVLFICFSILFFMKFLANISIGADQQEIQIESNLEKYINFKISDQDKGTLVQYNVKTGLEQNPYIPIQESELMIAFNQIDGKYPSRVKVITKRTETTNGKTEGIQENYQYNESTGTVFIKASNQNDNGDLINNSNSDQNARDEYVIIGYYDTYIEEIVERDLDIRVVSNYVLSEDDRVISQQNEFKGKVKDNIGNLSSVSYDTIDIANGYIKSNVINGTSYHTPYTEIQSINISKKEAQEKIKILENNTIIKTEQNQKGEEITQELENDGNLVYKSSKIKKEDIVNILGEDGVIEILDNHENLLGTIDKNTEFAEDGTVVISYENEPESIIVETSQIQNEGILKIENTKEVKETMLEAVNAKIKTTGKIVGIKEEITKTETEEINTPIETFTNDYENVIPIKDAQTNVTMQLSNTEWTNKEQNEVTFDIYANSNSTEDNMLKNPTIKIELPSQVEKVILGGSSVVYANGLELQEPYLETNENGNIVIVANLKGEQTEYDENTLGLITDVKIVATIILNKSIENTIGDVKLTYTNQYTLDGNTEVKNQNEQVKIESYQEEIGEVEEDSIVPYSTEAILGATTEELNGLTLEVVPVKGDTNLKNGDIVYEGEFIKYNIKVTNTSDKQIDNIKVVGTVPEGTIYGELEAEYDKIWGKYDYNYDDQIREKTIEIGSLDVGQSVTKFYEVKVNNLEERQAEKQIGTNIKIYVQDTEIASYEISNVVKPAEVQVFLTSNPNGIGKSGWNYHVKLVTKEERTVKVKVQLPIEFSIGNITTGGIQEKIRDINISEDNIITATIDLVSEDSEGNNLISISGDIETSKINNKAENSEIGLSATATVTLDDISYRSNENRIIYYYDNISIVMTSNNEGENVKYGDEIDYEITIKNIGRSNLDNYYATTLDVIDYLPENVKPISLAYENWIEQLEVIDEQNNIYDSTGVFNKQEYEEDISITHFYDNGEKLPNINLGLVIPYGESVVIKVKTTAGFVREKTKIENNVAISGDDIHSKTSNTIIHTILPYNYEENEDPDDPNNPDNPDDPNNPDNPDNPSDSDGRYSISGVAWIDENQDGNRQTGEKLLEGMSVILVNSNNSSTIIARQTTDLNGAYRFSDLEKGNYIVVFNYDTDTYLLTEYQKNGVSNTLNSDATNKEINLLGTQTKVGLTDIIYLDASVSNIDIGLIKNKICDLKLDKYISKVTVRTSSGTKEQTYNNTQLAKVEIRSKEIQGATVVVEYKIVVTNEGELPVSSVKVVDYLPTGFNFSSELNKSWTTVKSGEVTSITNQRINAGESMELTLTLTKSMTSNSTGTFTNIAEIGEMTNSLGTKDTDSVPENKVENEDDYSKVDLIISISTGEIIIYISFFIILLAIIGFTIKFGISKTTKISLFSLILILIVVIHSNNVIAAGSSNYLPDILWLKNPNTGETFTGFDDSGNIYSATCDFQGGPATSEMYRKFTKVKETYADSSITGTEKTEGSIVVDKEEKNNFTIKQIDGSNYLLGPFKINNSNATSYEYQVETTTKTLTKLEPCDGDGKTLDLTGKSSFTFYLKISTKDCDFSKGELIELVKLNAMKNNVKKTCQYNRYITAFYRPECYYKEYYGGKETYTSLNTTERMYKGVYCKNWPTGDSISLGPDTIFQPAYVSAQKTIEKVINDKENDSKVIEWEYEYGGLLIEKKDADKEDVKLKGVTFEIKGPSYPQGTTVTTGLDGKTKTLINLIPGDYTIKELNNPNYGYTEKVEVSKNISSGVTVSCKLKNPKQTGNLKIEKQDADSGDHLKGVSFKIKRKDENKYIQVNVNNEWKKNCTGIIHVDDMRYVDAKSDGTTFITNDTGIIEVRNILKGEYEVEEVSVGDEYFWYEIDDDYITWSYTSVANDDNTGSGSGSVATVTVKKRSSVNTKDPPDYENRNEVLTFKNKKKYIKLSGRVWEDGISTKQSYRNYLYDFDVVDTYYDDRDHLLQHVKVTLKDKDGQVLAGPKETDENGKYIFGDYKNDPNENKVKIEDLDGAYVEFEYNGMSYESVPLESIDFSKSNDDKTSKAIDTESRPEFNERYATITNNLATSQNGQSTELKYDTKIIDNTNVSKLIYGNEKDLKYGYEGQEFPISGVYSPQYSITANTKDVDKDINMLKTKAEEVLKSGGDEIENINLGLYKREQPDISLVKDIDSVRLGINGYNHVYNYNQKLKDEILPSENDFNVGVKYKSKYTGSYSRAIYQADYEYENQDRSKELKVYITYKIRMINESSNLKVRVNSITDYFDINYYINEDGTKNVPKVGIAINEKTREVEGSLEHTEIEENNDYVRSDININTTIDKEKYQDIYVQFELNRQAILKILNSKENLDNVAEINSYSVFDDKGAVYAGIDQDSNPGNTIPGDTKTYEDDTDSAPGLQLVLKEKPRKLTGKVFLDSTSDELMTGQERNGDGIYKEGEEGIKDVTVTLTENTENGKVYTATTDEKGDFLIEGYIPGDYTLTYTWGDETYTVQDYKGTIYNNKERAAKDKQWYKTESPRYSDAMDDYTLRENIDQEMIGIEEADKPIGQVPSKHLMQSTTPIMGIGIEAETDGNTRYGITSIETEMEGNKFVPKDFIIKNVDFGIVERARQVMNIDKRVSALKITLANGQVIVDGKVKEDEQGNLKIENDQNVVSGNIPLDKSDNGYLWATLDSELIQGATIEITYNIVVRNDSEVDYNKDTYYLYGEISDTDKAKDIIKMIPEVYDYLDREMVKENTDDEWTQVDMNTYNESVPEETITERYLYKSYKEEVMENGTKKAIYDELMEYYRAIVEEWNSETIKTVRQERLANKTIYKELLEKEMLPGEIRKATMTGSKVLSNSNEIDLKNDSEIVRVTRNSQAGRRLTPNILYARAERVIVTPPTGENRQYGLIIALAISTFVILGTGIVFIKKKVLK